MQPSKFFSVTIFRTIFYEHKGLEKRGRIRKRMGRKILLMNPKFNSVECLAMV